MDKKHIKIRKYTMMPDGSFKVSTESYFDRLASVKEEVVKQVKTDHNRILEDWVACLTDIKDPSNQDLWFHIAKDDLNHPVRIVKQYTVMKENFNKR